MKKPFFIRGLALLTLLVLVPTLSSRTPTQATDDQPNVIAAVAPVFPPIARSAHATGDVVVEAKINSRGEVESSKVVSGHPLLQSASKEAAKKWKFSSSAGDRAQMVRLVFSFGRVEGGKSVQEYTTTFMPRFKVEVMWNSTAY